MSKRQSTSGEELTEREQVILHFVVGDYIASATPVGSRAISNRHYPRLSPATIRNVMADLENLGYLSHPHTSAGRMPTDRGYRFYVDKLMEIDELSESEREAIGNTLQNAAEPEELLREASKLLGKISHQLGLVSSPQISRARLERLELISLSSLKIAVLLFMQSVLVRTIVMEISSEVRRETLDSLTTILNERLSGRTLKEIRDTFSNRFKDVQDEETGIIRLLLRSKHKLFDDPWTRGYLHIGGTQDIVHQPEFGDPENFRAFIRLVDDEDTLSNVLGRRPSNPGEILVTIGDEHQDEKLKNYSTVTSLYRFGQVVGTLGVIGPKRMSYSRMIPLVEHMSRTVSVMLS